MPPRRRRRTGLGSRSLCLRDRGFDILRDRSIERRIGLWLFIVTAGVFLLSPIWGLSDARYTMLLSDSILLDHSTHLNRYQFPAPIQESSRCVSPTGPVALSYAPYQLDRIDGNVAFCYPNGSSILSIPFVGAMNLLGVYPYDPDGHYNLANEELIQRLLAASLMAGFTIVVFRTALLILSITPAVLIAVGTAFGSQVWSTASRVMWAHTWLILLGGLLTYKLLRRERNADSPGPVIVATLLAWMYFVRPTGAIPIICVTVYTFLFYRNGFIYYALTGLAWFTGFVCYSWFTFGKLIADYYLDSRISINSIATALPAILISPSRGLFIFVPALLFVFYLLIRYWTTIPYARLAILSLSIVTIQTVLVALWPVWWGGYSYGPRLLADAIPWLALLAILGCAARLRSANNAKFSRAEIATALSLLALSIAINGRGAISVATATWNVEVDIDRHPERVWNWSNPQFMAGVLWKRKN
jgi:hypothetical protein